MTYLINWKKHLLISLILIILIIVFPFKQIWGLFYLIYTSLILGNYLFIKNSYPCKIFFGILFTLVIASLINTIGFYLFKLNDLTHLFNLLIIPLLYLPIIIKYPLIIDFPKKIRTRIDLKKLTLILIYLVLLFIITYLIFNSQTGLSIRSPWEVIPSQIFFIYFFASFILLNLLIFNKKGNYLTLIILHFFISFIIAVITYQVGFDYDPFIHRANLKLILESGTLLPKPFYYIGQYSLIIYLHKLFDFSVNNIDKILVPVMSAVYLPLTIYYALKNNFKIKDQTILLIIFLLLAIPFANFIVTTPQALANVFLLITIFLGIYFISHPKVAIWPLALLALMTLAIHPLSGIPAIIFIVLLFIYHRSKLTLPKILGKSIFWEVVIVSFFALPFAFFINSQTLSEMKISLNSNWTSNLVTILNNQDYSLFYRPFISIYDLIYNYGYNIIAFLIFLIAITVIFLIIKKRFKRFSIYPVMTLIMLANYLILITGISFFSLLSHEQQNYPVRVLEISLYFLLPLIILAFYLLINKLLKQSATFILLATILISLALTTSFYLSYPRIDKISEDHGFSTSLTDIKTVNFLEKLNQGRPYIVLASQPISASAIQELSYKYYYNNFYFYPVPTGNRLYELFEDLAYNKEKTIDVIATARYLTEVNTIYFVINDYWFDAQDRILDHKQSADYWYAIDGKNYIFEYID